MTDIKSRLRRIWILIGVEGDMSYGFPTIPAILIIFILTAIFSVSGLVVQSMNVNLWPSEGWDWTAAVQKLEGLISGAGTQVFVVGFANYIWMMFVLIPVLVASNMAQGFSNGQYRTLLSYPIDRRGIVLTKFGVAVLVVAGTASLSPLIVMGLYSPTPIALLPLVLAVVSIWAMVALQTAFSLVFAFVSRSIRATTLAGIGLNVFLYSLAWYRQCPDLLRGALFPPLAASEYLGYGVAYFFTDAVLLQDVFLSVGCCLLLTVVLLCLGYIVFRRTEF
jgi:ABC-type transport system involved in multi-copper enzyme maturation permease subunit